MKSGGRSLISRSTGYTALSFTRGWGCRGRWGGCRRRCWSFMMRRSRRRGGGGCRWCFTMRGCTRPDLRQGRWWRRTRPTRRGAWRRAAWRLGKSRRCSRTKRWWPWSAGAAASGWRLSTAKWTRISAGCTTLTAARRRMNHWQAICSTRRRLPVLSGSCTTSSTNGSGSSSGG